MSVRRYGCRDRNRTCCLEGMNLTSCHCSTLPYRATVAAHRMYDEFRAGRDGGQTLLVLHSFYSKINRKNKEKVKRKIMVLHS